MTLSASRIPKLPRNISKYMASLTYKRTRSNTPEPETETVTTVDITKESAVIYATEATANDSSKTFYENLKSKVNGNNSTILGSTILEGLHYEYIKDSERFDSTDDNIHMNGFNYATGEGTADLLGGRYVAGLGIAHKVAVFDALKNSLYKVFSGEQYKAEVSKETDIYKISVRIAQFSVAAVIAIGTPIRIKNSIASDSIDWIKLTKNAADGNKDSENKIDKVMDSYRETYCIKGNNDETLRDIVRCAGIATGFEMINEAYANFFHTNHHNESASRFIRGIRYSIVALQNYLNLKVIDTDGIDFTSAHKEKFKVGHIILRQAIHDSNHANVVYLVYDKDIRAKVKYLITDHNRYSFSNAPAGVSDVSAAKAVLEIGKSQIDTRWSSKCKDLNEIEQEIDFNAGVSRFKYSPFYLHICKKNSSVVNSKYNDALAIAGSLVKIAQNADLRDIHPFFRDTAFRAVAIRKHASPEIEAYIKNRLKSIQALSNAKSTALLNNESLKEKISSAILDEVDSIPF
uniref:Uncharacterized protein n=1 Tax=insect yue-like virus 1 TaxID=2860250 RepID=A0A8F5XPG5_9VIRU|nr:hypothetical protein [insect yue-like virus 1]